MANKSGLEKRPSNASVPSIPRLVPSSAQCQIPSSSLHIPFSLSSHTPPEGLRQLPHGVLQE